MMATELFETSIDSCQSTVRRFAEDLLLRYSLCGNRRFSLHSSSVVWDWGGRQEQNDEEKWKDLMWF
jgi:hypothetical protein